MHITKDECILLAEAMEEYKYELSKKYPNINCYGKMEDLQTKLYKLGDDNRRKGRKSQNDLIDIVKRYCKVNHDKRGN